MVKLTTKQRLFVEAYMGAHSGNGLESARAAGYGGNAATLRAIASENLTKPNIKASIEALIDQDPLVWSRFDRQRFWTRVAQGKELDRGEEPAMKDRLKAAELLGKTQLDFVTQIHAKTESTVAIGAKLDFSSLTPEQRLLLFDSIIDEDTDDDADEE